MNDPIHRNPAPRQMVEQQMRARGIRDDGGAARPWPRFPASSSWPEALREQQLCRRTAAHRPRADHLPAVYRGLHDRVARTARAAKRCWKSAPGSGYQTAVLAEIVARVYTVEVIPELSAPARGPPDRAAWATGTSGFKVGRGQEGWPEFAPFDRIILTAAPEEFPRALLSPAGRRRHRRRPGGRR